MAKKNRPILTLKRTKREGDKLQVDRNITAAKPSTSVGNRSHVHTQQYNRSVTGEAPPPAKSYVAHDIGSIYGDVARERPDVRGRGRMSDTIDPDTEDDFYESEYGTGTLDEAYLGATTSDLQLQRISHLSPSIQRGVQELAQGGSIYGVSALDAAAAVEEFGSVIQGDPSLWANQLSIDESVELPRSKQDIRTVLSVLQNTSGEYLDKGPGSDLAGHTLLEDRQSKMDSDLQLAMSYVGELSEHYLHKETIGSSIYGERKSAVADRLTSRFMEGVFSDESTAILPLPNEVGVRGLRPTASYRGFGGTKFDRVGFDIYAQDNGLTDQDGDAFWKHKPSVKNSLFPHRSAKGSTPAAMEHGKRTQDFEYEQALTKARFARKVLREQMQTNRDESAGQIRMSGWDRPYGDQADQMNLLNEAAIQDLDFLQVSSRAVDTTVDVQAHGAGSDRGGAYGLNPVSEVDAFIEDASEAIVADIPEIEGIVQRTPEWYEARKGMVTASKLTDKTGKRISAEQMAQKMAMERLGINDEFIGNSYTEEGIKGEPIALQSFLHAQRKLGNDLSHTEVGLLQNPKYPGFGASPDGRLSGADGSNQGLLELKYLTTNGMKNVVDKYTPQMQLQMAITGETQTHFFALDQYTGESVHELVKADPELQRNIFETGTQAMEMEPELTALRIQKMVRQTKYERENGIVTPSDTTGQTASFNTKANISAPMTGFRTNNGQVGDDMVRLYERQQSAEQAAIAQAWADSDPAAAFINKDDGGGGDGGASDKEQARASREAAKAIKELGKSAKSGASMVSELVALVKSGTSSIIDEDTASRMAGLDASQGRGIRERLQQANLTPNQTAGLLSSAARQTQGFAEDPNSVGSYLGNMAKVLSGPGASSDLKQQVLPSSEDLLTMNGADRLAMAMDAVNSVASPLDKMKVASSYGFPELAAANDVTGEDISSARDETILGRLEKARSTGRGFERAREFEQETLESTSQVGEDPAFLIGVAGSAAAVVSSVTAGYLGRGALAKGASSTVPKAVNLVKGLSTAAKATPIALAAAAAPMAIRHFGDVKDDGGMADSGLDVLEFAAYGAAIGSVVPVAGTIAGAAIGAGVGLWNEAYEYFGDETPVVPSSSIDKIATPNEAKQSVINNFEVITTVTPDSTLTEVSENGEQIYLEEDNSTGFVR